MGEVLVLQHLEAESPDLIGRVLKEAGHQVCIIRSDQEELPAALPASCHGLVVMGGPMGVYDGERYNWITPEISLIESALKRRLPLMGVCLGSQMLAAAAGARVYPGERPKEIGWYKIRLSEAGITDPLCRHLAEPSGGGEATVFQWHGDTFDLPPGAELLAGSQLFPCQAFRIGNNAYGFQFHFEVGAEAVSQWLDLWPEVVRAEGVDAQTVREETARQMKAFTARGRKLIEAFGKLLNGGDAAVSA